MRKHRFILAWAVVMAVSKSSIAHADETLSLMIKVGPLAVGSIETRSVTGPIRGFWARLDTTSKQGSVIVTAPLETKESAGPAGAEAKLIATDLWAKEAKATLAINANFFGKLGGGKGTAQSYAEGQFADIIGLSVCGGKVVSPPRVNKDKGDPALVIMKSGLAKAMRVSDVAAACTDSAGADPVQWAVAGVGGSDTDATEGTLLVAGGVSAGTTARVQPSVKHPRTAAGASADGSRLILVVIDGRQPTHSEGVTLVELAEIMIRLGSHDAVNLDGGGSSAFVFAPPAGSDAKPLRNKPSDGRFRPVANHLGIVVKMDEKKAVVQ